MVARNLACLMAIITLSNCSFVLDFDDVSNLRCGCLPEYVCLVGSDRCVLKNSVDDFKSCDPQAMNPDDLCQPGSRCVNRAERGHRCLPDCTPSNYSTPESGERVAAECPIGTTCWPDGGMGVCDEGECTDLPNNCPAGQRCATFNGAGVCFTGCEIFVSDNSCGGDQICHPIGNSSVVSCIDAGEIVRGAICDDTMPCARNDETGRPMTCDRPANNEGPRRCWPICNFGDGSRCTQMGETCVFSRSNVDPSTGANLGICFLGG